MQQYIYTGSQWSLKTHQSYIILYLARYSMECPNISVNNTLHQQSRMMILPEKWVVIFPLLTVTQQMQILSFRLDALWTLIINNLNQNCDVKVFKIK